MTPLSFWSAGDLPSEWHWRESSVDPAGLVCRQCHAAGRLRGARRGGRDHSEDMWCTPSGAAGHGGGEFPGAPGADLMGLSGGWLPDPPQSIQTMNPPHRDLAGLLTLTWGLGGVVPLRAEPQVLPNTLGSW